MNIKNILKSKKVPIIDLKGRLIQLEECGFDILSAKELHDLVFENCSKEFTKIKQTQRKLNPFTEKEFIFLQDLLREYQDKNNLTHEQFEDLRAISVKITDFKS